MKALNLFPCLFSAPRGKRTPQPAPFAGGATARGRRRGHSRSVDLLGGGAPGRMSCGNVSFVSDELSVLSIVPTLCASDGSGDDHIARMKDVFLLKWTGLSTDCPRCMQAEESACTATMAWVGMIVGRAAAARPAAASAAKSHAGCCGKPANSRGKHVAGCGAASACYHMNSEQACGRLWRWG